ncbi:hypothetical protein [Nocardia acidivorans]|nr:hypothetical protein [Nocardia acidivorans]
MFGRPGPVAEIVAARRGSVRVEDSPSGGARLKAALPVTANSPAT